MTYRPKMATSKGDVNHFIPRDFLRDRCGGFEVCPREVRGLSYAYTANLRGVLIVAFDMSRYGGVFTDWLVSFGGIMVLVEIKTPEAVLRPNQGMTAGEKWAAERVPVKIISTADEFAALAEEYVERMT